MGLYYLSKIKGVYYFFIIIILILGSIYLVHMLELYCVGKCYIFP